MKRFISIIILCLFKNASMAQFNNDIKINKVSWMNAIDYIGLPISNNYAFTFYGVVENIGINPQSNCDLTVTVYNQASALVFQDNIVLPALAPGQTDTIYLTQTFLASFPVNSYYDIEFSVQQDSIDDDISNNVRTERVTGGDAYQISEFMNLDTTYTFSDVPGFYYPFCACITIEYKSSPSNNSGCRLSFYPGPQTDPDAVVYGKLFEWERSTGSKNLLYSTESTLFESSVTTNDITYNSNAPREMQICLPYHPLDSGKTYLACMCTYGGTGNFSLVGGAAGSDSSSWIYDEFNTSWLLPAHNLVYKYSINGADCCVQSVNDRTEINMVSFYPNPSDGNFVLQIEQEISASPILLKIQDISGRSIYTQQFTNLQSKTPLNVSHISTGIYWVSLYSDDELITCGKLVIQN